MTLIYVELILKFKKSFEKKIPVFPKKISSLAKIYGPVTFFLYDLIKMDIQLILEFKKSFEKNCPVFPKKPKHFFFGCFFGQKRACNFFAIWLRMLISFLNDVEIKIISEFNDSFGKYYPVFPKNPKNWGVKSDGFLLKF